MEARELTAGYGKRKSFHLAIDRLTFEVAEGEVLGIVGPSGCGKSTLLRACCGLVAASSGDVELFGLPPEEARRQRWLGIVSQSPALLPRRTVERNIGLPLEMIGEDAGAKVESVLELVGLEDARHARPHELSGGMKQRVAFARAVVLRPRVLMLDEPFTALDEILRERLASEFCTLQRRLGQTALFVTHSVEEAVFVSDSVLVLSRRPGRIRRRLRVELPRDRSAALRTTEEYFHATRQVRAALRE